VATPITTTPAAEDSLRHLLTHGGYWRWSLATQLIRLPSFMASMAYVLVSIELLGSAGPGGLILAVMFIVAEISAPFTGRLIDRLGIARWAPWLLLATAAGRLVLAAAFAAGAPTWALVVIVGLFAALGSGAGGIVRVMLGRTVPTQLLGRALAVDASVVEVVIIAAPFLVTATALAGGLGPLFAMALTTAIGALLLWPRGSDRAAEPAPAAGLRDEAEQAAAAAPPSPDTAPPADPPAEEHQPASGSLWRHPEYLFWLFVAVAFGHLLGTAETGALPAVREVGGTNATASALIAVLAGASAVAGVLYAVAGPRIRWSQRVQACLLLALMTVAGLIIGMADGYPMLFAGFLLLGLCTAPINTVRSHAAGLIIPKDRQVEGFAILDSANGLGFALAGVLLALLSVSGMLSAGVVTTVLALVAAPLLLRGRWLGAERRPGPPA
jgi:MFS family permease